MVTARVIDPGTRCVHYAVENAPGADLSLTVVRRCSFAANDYYRSWVVRKIWMFFPPLRARHRMSHGSGFVYHVRLSILLQVAIPLVSYRLGVASLLLFSPFRSEMIVYGRCAPRSRA